MSGIKKSFYLLTILILFILIGCKTFVETHPDIKIDHKLALKKCAQLDCWVDYYLVDNYGITYSISSREYNSYYKFREVIDYSAQLPSSSGTFVIIPWVGY